MYRRKHISAGRLCKSENKYLKEIYVVTIIYKSKIADIIIINCNKNHYNSKFKINVINSSMYLQNVYF